MKPILQVEHLVKQYPKRAQPAVTDVSFSVEPGEFFVLLGPQGAGKSTIIAILATLLAKSRGQVTIAGRDLDQQAAAIRQEIGVVGSSARLDGNLTAEENIRQHVCRHELYPYAPHYRLMPTHYRRRIEELTTVVGLDCDLFKPVQSFSSVMQYKLAIIRSLMHDPLLLFLDEPSADLDPVSRRHLWRYLREIQRSKGITLFVATCEFEEAEEADHFCIIHQGQVVLDATPHQMQRRLLAQNNLGAAARAKLKPEWPDKSIGFDSALAFTSRTLATSTQTLAVGGATSVTRQQGDMPSLEDAYARLVSENR